MGSPSARQKIPRKYVIYTKLTAGYSCWHLSNAIIPDHFRVRMALIPKAATIYLIAFAVTAVLLNACDSLAFEQDGRGGGARQSPEAARQAEELFQEALLLSDTQ